VIVDLVSPWLAALEAADPAAAQHLFRRRHAELLESLRRARAPMFDSMPLTSDPAALRPLAKHAADPARQQALREAVTHAATLGADGIRRVTLVALDLTGDAMEPLPYPGGDAVLIVSQLAHDRAWIAALGRAAVAVTRWSATDSASALRAVTAAEWNRWDLGRNTPLGEWIYTEGVALHLVAALLPELSPSELIGVSRGAFERLRQREKVFRALLNADLKHCGIGLLLRWLTPGAPAGQRTAGNVVIPPRAGQYLAWRMTAERVARVGLGVAIRGAVS
jgi:hypothetical protein